jgi:myo-inositol-1-phosphate synthase
VTPHRNGSDNGRAAEPRSATGNGKALGDGRAPSNGLTKAGRHSPVASIPVSAGSQSGKVRVAIIGVGNCASAFVQGVQYYADADPGARVPGLMHVDLGGYHVRDIEFTAAFDIDRAKVGKDLGQAIWAGQNNTIKFARVPRKLGVPVYRGMTHDGLGKYLKEKIVKAPGETADIVRILRETRTDVVVSYLPVGSEQATKWYVEQVLEAGCGFVNCIPVFIAREDYWDRRFRKAGLPIVGDDIKSQVGATIVHRTLARLFADRGVKMLRTSQLNVGGNMDFYNMLERERLESKKISKTNAVTSIMDEQLPASDVYIGPSDYVPWLTDRKWAHIRVEGQAFGDVPLNVELKLEVWDSPNSAGIVIDAVRCCKLALNHGVGGQLDGPSSYLMKSPHNQRPDHEARAETERFIAKYSRAAPARRSASRSKSATGRPAGGQAGGRDGAPAGKRANGRAGKAAGAPTGGQAGASRKAAAGASK